MLLREANRTLESPEIGGCHGKQLVENSLLGIIGGFHIGHSTILFDGKILNMTGGALNILKDLFSFFSIMSLPSNAGFEIIQQIKFQMVDQAYGNFIGQAI